MPRESFEKCANIYRPRPLGVPRTAGFRLKVSARKEQWRTFGSIDIRKIGYYAVYLQVPYILTPGPFD